MGEGCRSWLMGEGDGENELDGVTESKSSDRRVR